MISTMDSNFPYFGTCLFFFFFAMWYIKKHSSKWGLLITIYGWLNTLRPRQHGRHFADDSFKHIFLNEDIGISIKISLKFVHKGPINNIPAMVQIMAWHQRGDKPLSEPMVGCLLMHICVTRPQWVKTVLSPLLTCWRYQSGTAWGNNIVLNMMVA